MLGIMAQTLEPYEAEGYRAHSFTGPRSIFRVSGLGTSLHCSGSMNFGLRSPNSQDIGALGPPKQGEHNIWHKVFVQSVGINLG